MRIYYIENVIIDYRDRPLGSKSKLNTIPDGIKVLCTIVKLFRTYKSIRYFGVLSAILMIIGIVFMISVIIEYFSIGLVLRFPTLIVSCFMILTGIISWFSGLILETITWKNRKDFEMELHIANYYRKNIYNI